jgi:hypothetical protein
MACIGLFGPTYSLIRAGNRQARSPKPPLLSLPQPECSRWWQKWRFLTCAPSHLPLRLRLSWSLDPLRCCGRDRFQLCERPPRCPRYNNCTQWRARARSLFNVSRICRSRQLSEIDRLNPSQGQSLSSIERRSAIPTARQHRACRTLGRQTGGSRSAPAQPIAPGEL